MRVASIKHDNSLPANMKRCPGCGIIIEKIDSKVTESFCVGPIWNNNEAKTKADKWIGANKPGQGWKFTGHWNSRGGTSYC